MWVKICGLTTPEGVGAAIGAEADAVGFVFAPSKRRVTSAVAVTLVNAVPKHIARVAVMLHPSQAEVDEVLATFNPDVLQTDVDDFAVLKLPATLIRSPVFRAGKALPEVLPHRLLFEGPVSGTGEVADWVEAAALARRAQLVLAGGLNPTNVAAAIRAVQPFGVDVSSGVESAPGVKSVEKIHAFVSAARAAHANPSYGVQ